MGVLTVRALRFRVHIVPQIFWELPPVQAAAEVCPLVFWILHELPSTATINLRIAQISMGFGLTTASRIVCHSTIEALIHSCGLIGAILTGAQIQYAKAVLALVSSQE